MIITQYIRHVMRAMAQGFKPLTLCQFSSLAKRINAAPPRQGQGLNMHAELDLDFSKIELTH